MHAQQNLETLSMRWSDALTNGDLDGALHVALQGYLVARAMAICSDCIDLAKSTIG
jgi:hypothetical protein